MTPDQSASQPPGTGSGQPIDIGRETPLVRAVDNSVKALETHRTYIERDLAETRTDIRDVRDRMIRLEVKVDALPSKVWIGTVVVSAFVLLSGVVTLLFKVFGH